MENLTERDKKWIEENVIGKGFTRLQMIRKLESVNYPRERIEIFARHYEEVEEEKERARKRMEEMNKEKTKEEETSFKEQVEKYTKGEKLSFMEKMEVKGWLKRVKKMSKILEETIKALKKEYEFLIEKQEKKGIKLENEMKDFKKEIIDRIIDTKDILIIEDPNTGEEATKESLEKCEINQLISILEENVKILKEAVEGKIEKEK